MLTKGTSYKLVIITACIAVAPFLGGCKKSWSPARSTGTPTPVVKVVDTSDLLEGNHGNGELVPVTTLFPGRHGQEGTLTPTPTATPTPTPTPETGVLPNGDPTPEPTPSPTPIPTPTPTPKPTNTPRPTKTPPTPLPETAYPTPTPTPGSVDFVLISGTPTPMGN